MPDEVTLGELGRRLDAIADQLRDLVGRAEYTAYKVSVDKSLTDLERDTAKLSSRLESAETQRSQVRLALLCSFLAPIVVALFFIFLRSQGVQS